jgi:ABC-type Fe3+-hydroxamate transport system substrate-binding protein
MLRRAFLALLLLSWCGAAWGGAMVDATGRRVMVPVPITRILPAGPPAAILLVPRLAARDEGQGPSRQVTMANIRALDPEVIVFTDPTMHTPLGESTAWGSLRAVRQGHAFVAPNLPFGWIDEPPSINRLLGLAWLGGSDPHTLATLFNAAIYGRVLTAPQVDAVVAGAHSLQP